MDHQGIASRPVGSVPGELGGRTDGDLETRIREAGSPGPWVAAPSASASIRTLGPWTGSRRDGQLRRWLKASAQVPEAIAAATTALWLSSRGWLIPAASEGRGSAGCLSQLIAAMPWVKR